MDGPEPKLKTGKAPVVEIDFVEARVTGVVKPPDDFAVRATAGEQGVKVIADVFRESGDFAARFGKLNGTGVKVRLAGDGSSCHRC